MTRTACLNAIYELAKKDERVVFIGSDLSPNTLTKFREEMPDRFFMEGVQEQNIIGMAAGLALEGFIPYVNTIATFLTRRCYEQIAVDICAHNLPVRLIGNGGGLVYAPLGLTHTAIDDIAIMRAIPHMSVVVCSDNEEMKLFMPETLKNLSPMYIRLGKDSDPIVTFEKMVDAEFHTGGEWCAHLAEVEWNKSPAIFVVSTGIMTAKALQIAKLLKPLTCDVTHVAIIKPLPRGVCLNLDNDPYPLIVTMEEGIVNGGLGSAVLEELANINAKIPVLRFGIPDAFPHHYGEQDDLLETYGLTPEKMAARIKEFYDAL